MELRVFLDVPQKELPGDYRPTFVSLLKALLQKYYPDAYENLYENGNQPKNFTFAVQFQTPVFTGNALSFSDEAIIWSISSDDEYSSLLFYNAFQRGTGYCHPLKSGGTMIVRTVQLRAQPRMHCHAATIKFLSPLVVRKHTPGVGDRYFVFQDAEFADTLRYVVNRQLGRETDLLLEPVAPRKTVVRSFGTKIRCSIGTYRLAGEPEVLDLLSRSGIGSRRGEGYGYFKVVGG